MLKYDILAISTSNLAELGPIFHPLGLMFPVRLIMSGVLCGNEIMRGAAAPEGPMTYDST